MYWKKNKNNNNFIGIYPFRLCNRKYNECLKKVLIWKKMIKLFFELF